MIRCSSCPRLRIESGNRDPGFLDAKIPGHRFLGGARAGNHQPLGQIFRNILQRDMGCHRNHAQCRPRQHHHRILAGDAASLRHEFGLTRITKPNFVELRFRNRRGDDGSSISRTGQPTGNFKGVQRTLRTVHGSFARACGRRLMDMEHRQCSVERVGGVDRLVNFLDRNARKILKVGKITNRKKRLQPCFDPLIPTLSDDLWPDASGVPARNGEGLGGPVSH